MVVDGQTVAPAVAVQAFPTSPIWTIEVKAQPIAPPVASPDRLFLALQSGITARRLADGTDIWTTALVVDGPMAASEQRLVVVVKEELQALDTATGAVAWTDRPGRVECAATRARRMAAGRIRRIRDLLSRRRRHESLEPRDRSGRATAGHSTVRACTCRPLMAGYSRSI